MAVHPWTRRLSYTDRCLRFRHTRVWGARMDATRPLLINFLPRTLTLDVETQLYLTSLKEKSSCSLHIFLLLTLNCRWVILGANSRWQRKDSSRTGICRITPQNLSTILAFIRHMGWHPAYLHFITSPSPSCMELIINAL